MEIPFAPFMTFQDDQQEVQTSMLGAFGWAVEMLRLGKRVTRSSWGKDVYLWFMEPAEVPRERLKEPHLIEVCGDNPTISVLGTLCMKTERGNVLTGWYASPTDIFARDWVLA